MKYVNKFLRNLSPYNLASHKIWEVEAAERKNILKLDWNEATIPPSPKVLEKIEDMLKNDSFFNLYPKTYSKELYYELSNYVSVPIENIQYFASSDSLHEYIGKIYLSPGDNVLILGPSYDNFRLTCEAQGAKVNYVMYSKDFEFDPNLLEDAIKEIKPALVYICNPNNPTGNVISYDCIKDLIEKFSDSLFLIDEAYYEFSTITAKDLVLKYENILISRTMSKAFAIANFRIGYLIASEDNIKTISKIRNPKNIQTLAQEAAIAVLKDVDYMKNYVNEVNESKITFTNFLMSFKDKLVAFPGGGNFILVRFINNEDKINLYNHLNDQNIFVRNLTHSSLLNNCLRITIGTNEQMKRVSNAILSYFNGN
jgi:histidinol-phosphate aminotransferase